jgi:hypothetical protein
MEYQYVSPVPWHDPVRPSNPNTTPKIPGVPVIPPLPPSNPSYPKYAAQCGECGMLIPLGSWMYSCPNARCPVQPKVTC